MHITLITVGKLKEKYLRDGINEYLKRLQAYAKIDIIELADEKEPYNASRRRSINQSQGGRTGQSQNQA